MMRQFAVCEPCKGKGETFEHIPSYVVKLKIEGRPDAQTVIPGYSIRLTCDVCYGAGMVALDESDTPKSDIVRDVATANGWALVDVKGGN